MRLKFMLTGVMVWIGLLAPGHPLHLTFTNLEFNTKNNRWTLTLKVFSDDFATNLRMATGLETIIEKKTKSSEAEQLLKKWLETRLQFWFDSKPIEFDTWHFDGIKVKEDASWITYTFTAPSPGSEIRIRNALLFDLYSDQKNLFILAMGQFQSAHEFKNKDQEIVIKLNK
ncbi:MAG: hypothetical protein NTV01_05200 [Bacteroidia bacterium]|nr:hypothetical protein [Bacteroidia bacterium]